jgi:hypothetical protein
VSVVAIVFARVSPWQPSRHRRTALAQSMTAGAIVQAGDALIAVNQTDVRLGRQTERSRKIFVGCRITTCRLCLPLVRRLAYDPGERILAFRVDPRLPRLERLTVVLPAVARTIGGGPRRTVLTYAGGLFVTDGEVPGGWQRHLSAEEISWPGSRTSTSSAHIPPAAGQGAVHWSDLTRRCGC